MKGEDENLVNPNLDSTALMIERGTKGAVIVNTNDALKVDFEGILLTEQLPLVSTAKPNILLKTGNITCDTDNPRKFSCSSL